MAPRKRKTVEEQEAAADIRHGSGMQEPKSTIIDNETPPTEAAHSSIVGGSSAAMRLACPASYKYQQMLPARVQDDSSEYADEGTALHAAMAYMIENDVGLEDVRGMEFGDPGKEFVMTDELIHGALEPAINWFDDLLDELEAAGETVEKVVVEIKAQMPGIPDAFGTCDLGVKTNKRTVIGDWKFGVGVMVRAFYPDDPKQPDGDGKLNAQPLFYARALMHTVPELFGGDMTATGMRDNDWPVDCYIIQPRLREDLRVDDKVASHAQVTVAELEEFRWALIHAVSKATSPDPGQPIRGEHCRFASCKTVCPRFTGAALDLSKMMNAVEKRKASPLGDVFDYTEALAAILDLKTVVEPLFKAAAEQAHTLMESGAKVPHYKLVPKRANRNWKGDPLAIEKAITKAGFERDQLFSMELKSPKQMEAVVKTDKKLLERIKNDLAPDSLVAKVSSGTTIAREDDPRGEILSLTMAIENFGKKLAAVLPKE